MYKRQTEDSLLEPRANSFLAALSDGGGDLGIAWLDLSTGDLLVQSLADSDLPACLARLEPKEVLVPERLLQRTSLFDVFGEIRDRLAPQPGARFDPEAGRRCLERTYQVGTLDGFGRFSTAEIAAAGALIAYVELTQKGRMPPLRRPRRVARGAVMEIDPATRRNLELVRGPSGGREGSLLAVIDRSITGPGARLLAGYLSSPLTDPEAIGQRLDLVGFWLANETARAEVRGLLTGMPDLERAVSRLSLGRGGPRDLAAVRDGLGRVAGLRLGATRPALTPVPPVLAAALRDLGEHSALVERLTRALGPDLPLLARDGGFIAREYAPQLDELILLRDEGRRLVAGLQARYAEATQIGALKVKHNNVLGYHVEVSAAQADKLMAGRHRELFIHRQTTASAVRFTTAELADLERRIAEAGDRALATELALFEDLVREVTGRAEEVLCCARAAAVLDVGAGLAELAAERGWCRPEVDGGVDFQIVRGRHPVVENALLAEGARPFVPNDCDLSPERRLWLLTGPARPERTTPSAPAPASGRSAAGRWTCRPCWAR